MRTIVTFLVYRLCPNCGRKISYKLEKTKDRANKKNSNCQSCVNKEIMNRPDIKEKNLTRMKEFYSDEGNRKIISERQSKRVGKLNSFSVNNGFELKSKHKG